MGKHASLRVLGQVVGNMYSVIRPRMLPQGHMQFLTYLIRPLWVINYLKITPTTQDMKVITQTSIANFQTDPSLTTMNMTGEK